MSHFVPECPLVLLGGRGDVYATVYVPCNWACKSPLHISPHGPPHPAGACQNRWELWECSLDRVKLEFVCRQSCMKEGLLHDTREV